MYNRELSNLRLGAFVIALGLLIVLVLIVGVASKRTTYRRWFLGALVSGADGRLSTSKFQAVIWTAVAIFGSLRCSPSGSWLACRSETR